MYCIHCGKELDDTARFCISCGSPVSVADATAKMNATSQSAYASPEAPYGYRQAQGQPFYGSQPQGGQASFAAQPTATQTAFTRAEASYKSEPKKSPGVIIAIAVVVTVLVVVAIAALFMGRQGSAGSAPGPSADAQSSYESSAPAESTAGGADEAAKQAQEEADAQKAAEEQAQAEAQQASEALQAAQAQARQNAQDAGRQVFEGTVEVTTYHDRALKIDSRLAEDFTYSGDNELVLLFLDAPVDTRVMDAAGGADGVYDDAHATVISLDNVEAFHDLDGQHIAVAALPDEMHDYSDITGALMSIGGTFQLLYTQDAVVEQQFDPAPQRSGADGDYILADSGERLYSRQELETLDNHTLFLARNEIFARHGRKFVNAELQDYFGSKSWYKPTIEADAFNDSMLTETELSNVRLMLDIENARGSEYV